MATPKDPAAVALGRRGGLADSPKKQQAIRKNLAKARRVLAKKRKAAKHTKA